MPKESSKPRKPYAAQACTICRAKKIKCDGLRPVCSPCASSGRDDECAWARETVSRKPRTEAHFEALKKRAESLQSYVDLLEGIVAKCVCQDLSAHRQFRAEQLEATTTPESDGEEDGSDAEITRELTVPTERLKLNENLGALMLHGLTSPWHFTDKLPREVISTKPPVENSLNTAYVLWVNDINASESDLRIDWSRHLPPEVPLDRREHDKILDLTFKFLTMWGQRVVPSLFLRDMHRALSVPPSEPPPVTPHYSPMLHNALLALSANFSDDPRIRDRAARECFANAAKSCLDAECKRPNISLVEALAFLGSYYGDKSDRIAADLHFGMCSRISQTLGFGVDSKGWVEAGLLTNDEMVCRNWTHWTVFSLDVCWALYFSRDFCWPPLDRHTTPMPFIDTESDQIPWLHPSVPPQPNYLSLAFSETASLLVIGHKIIDIVNSLRASGSASAQDLVKVDEKVSRIDLELHNWKSSLPPQLDVTLANKRESTPQRLMLHCAYWWCMILLHRPFFARRARSIQRSDREVDHVKLCKRAAEHILELLETWSSLYGLRYSPQTLQQVIYTATTVFFLLALQATANIRIAQVSLRSALAQVEQCLGFLDEMGQSWDFVVRTKEMLRSVLYNKLRPIIARRLEQKGIVGDLSAITPPLPDNAVTSPSRDLLSSNDAEWSQMSFDFFTQLQGNGSDGGPFNQLAGESEVFSGFLPSFQAPLDFWQRDLFGEDAMAGYSV
ncbi:hypothetical protein FB45DRAFT_918185 [Roridomyces roridus]|uniref:Zn(2)-C6 fungal-type domain-containing protein n=1 Tax=Roridomyces roridus TaxID=1738132 RepID=A0AAD7BRB0_9AGAR|nr:hypothetical protein FB45DRAFT_918185 [Roridomyces roridus]